MCQSGECSFMFRVEKMGAGDFLFAVQLANTMGWNMALEDFRFTTKLEPEGCFVLFYGSERVGIATCVSFGRVGWFGNLVVKEACRRRGAGALLVRYAINYLKSTGAETIGLYAYPHLIEFYKRFGFKPDVDYLVLQGKAVSPLTGGTVQLQKAKKQDSPALIDFDSQCFGACRRKLLEPILRDTGNLCYVAVDDHEIAGYCAATVYEETAGIGPLMCRQNRGGVAVALLQTVLSKLKNHDIFICVPTEETALLEVLLKAGLQEKFRVTRMFLGPAAAKGCTYMAESLERG
jgi:ribosomal protein S18 acetylase RimI-like enzyme